MSFVLPKEEGGLGVINLASRGATCRLQLYKVNYTKTACWTRKPCLERPLAHTILSHGENLCLVQSLFLMDLNGSEFYQELFTVWWMFQRSRTSCDSLFWLLREPVLYGTRFNVEHFTGSFMAQRFISAGTVALTNVFDLTGPNSLSRCHVTRCHVTTRLLSEDKEY